MAGQNFHADSGEVAIANGKTLLQVVAASNVRIVVDAWGVSFKGTSATDVPVLCQLIRQTTAGTMSAGSTGTNIAKKNNSNAETLQTTTQINATVEPTPGDIVDTFECHPQSGFLKQFPSGKEIQIAGAGRLGVKVTSAALTYNAVAVIEGAE